MTFIDVEDERLGYLRLARAMLVRAMMDATSPYPLLAAEARRWLVEEGLFFCEGLWLNPNLLLKWLEQGCPDAPIKGGMEG